MRIKVENTADLNIRRVNSLLVSSAVSAMDVTKDRVVASLFQSTAEEPSIFHIGKANCTIAFKSKMEQVEVLSDDGSRGAREVQREGVLDRSKIMKLKDEFLWKMGFVAPYNPADTNIAESKLMASDVHTLAEQNRDSRF